MCVCYHVNRIIDLHLKKILKCANPYHIIIFQDNPVLMLSNADVLTDTYRAPLLHTPGARMRCVTVSNWSEVRTTNKQMKCIVACPTEAKLLTEGARAHSLTQRRFNCPSEGEVWGQ